MMFAIAPYSTKLTKLSYELTMYSEGRVKLKQARVLLKRMLPVNPLSNILILRKKVVETSGKNHPFTTYLDEQISNYMYGEPQIDWKIATYSGVTGTIGVYEDKKKRLFEQCLYIYKHEKTVPNKQFREVKK